MQTHRIFIEAEVAFQVSSELLAIGFENLLASNFPAHILLPTVSMPTIVTGGSFYALKVFDDGNGDALYVGGKFTSLGGSNLRNIARFDGQTFTPLGGGLNEATVALGPDDHYILISSHDGVTEGPAGVDSTGLEIDPTESTCPPQ